MYIGYALGAPVDLIELLHDVILLLVVIMLTWHPVGITLCGLYISGRNSFGRWYIYID